MDGPIQALVGSWTQLLNNVGVLTTLDAGPHRLQRVENVRRIGLGTRQASQQGLGFLAHPTYPTHNPELAIERQSSP